VPYRFYSLFIKEKDLKWTLIPSSGLENKTLILFLGTSQWDNIVHINWAVIIF